MNNENALNRLLTIMDELREKCPWDKKQTIQSLRSMTIEETFELADAIDSSDWQAIKEELGDLLLHIVFYTKIANEQHQFNIDDVIETLCNKLVTRHPHIYGSVQVKDEEDVKKNWEKIKLSEGKKSVLSGVAKSLPAISKAERIQEKAKQVGFEWENKEDVWLKVNEEMHELAEAVQKNDSNNMADEMGDVLFSLVNYARFLKVDAEAALQRTNNKFINRFTQMETMAAERKKNLYDMSLEEMDGLWNTIKNKEKNC